jgi:hypothetical protein
MESKIDVKLSKVQRGIQGLQGDRGKKATRSRATRFRPQKVYSKRAAQSSAEGNQGEGEIGVLVSL